MIFFRFKTQQKKIQVCSSFFFDERRFDNGISTYGLYAIQRLNDYSLIFDNYLDEREIDFRSLFKRQKKIIKSTFQLILFTQKSKDFWLAIKQMFGKYVHEYVISRLKNKSCYQKIQNWFMSHSKAREMQVKVLMQKQHLPTY